jgi:hypothetical protein
MENRPVLCEEYFDIISIGLYKLAVFPHSLVLGKPILKDRKLTFESPSYILFSVKSSEDFLNFLVNHTIVQFNTPSINNITEAEINNTIKVKFEKQTELETTSILKITQNQFCVSLNVEEYFDLVKALYALQFQIYCYGSYINKCILELISQLPFPFFKEPVDFTSTQLVNQINENPFDDKIYLLQLVQRHFAVLKDLKMLTTLT